MGTVSTGIRVVMRYVRSSSVPASGNCLLPGTQWSSLFARVRRSSCGCGWLSSACWLMSAEGNLQRATKKAYASSVHCAVYSVHIYHTCAHGTVLHTLCCLSRDVRPRFAAALQCPQGRDGTTEIVENLHQQLQQVPQPLVPAPSYRSPACAFPKRCGAALSEPACDPPARRTRWPGRRCQRPPATG